MPVVMSILSIFKSEKLKISWRFAVRKPSEIVWKLLISPDGILAGEERDTEAKTGEVLEAYGSQNENILGIQALVADTDIHSVYSVAITPHDELFAAIGDILSETLDVTELRGTIDFAEYGKYIVFSYHERIL